MITTKEIDAKNGLKVDLLDKHVYLVDRSDLPERINALVKHEDCTMMLSTRPKSWKRRPESWLSWRRAGGAER
jgi:hypothetical protein